MTNLFRCGDYVLHNPTGETWLVAWCEGPHISAACWPESIGRTADCSLVYAATEVEHRKNVAAWFDSPNNDSRRAKVLDLYGQVLKQLAFDLDAFSRQNRKRCEAPNGFNHPIGDWSLSDWMTATLGELGEAANVVKKLNRVRDGIPGNDKSEAELRVQLADEIADAFIYLDLLAQAAEIRLSEAVRSKFERTSTKIGYTAADNGCGNG